MHAVVAHRDAVRHRDRPELERVAVGVAHPDLGRLGQPVQRQIAGGDLVPRRRDPDLGFAPVVVTHSDRAEHAARTGALDSVGHDVAVGLAVGGRLVAHAKYHTAYRSRVAERSSVLIIRLPRLSYLVVGFLVVGLAPIALYGG